MKQKVAEAVAKATTDLKPECILPDSLDTNISKLISEEMGKLSNKNK